jgi:hypothetical protein
MIKIYCTNETFVIKYRKYVSFGGGAYAKTSSTDRSVDKKQRDPHQHPGSERRAEYPKHKNLL